MIWENINVNLKATNMELTSAIEDYVVSRVTNLGKLLKRIQEEGGEVLFQFEVAKTTNHHKGGQVYRADCNVTINGENFYSSSEQEDMYAAIDDCKDQLFAEIKKKKERKSTLFMRGAKKLKDMMKGAQFWK